MATLIIAALFWGNCYSCPQVLLSAQKHGCCPHTKSGKSECRTQGLKNFVNTEKSAPAVIVTVAALELPEPVHEAAAPTLIPRAGNHAPPDALPLRI
jgi:hypothetical protein